ncbi:MULTISPECIES: transporter substrate-binding domain-containing protein [Vibrio]|uniref:Transporter substrate-binding domain-containing protein n=2 Tax=Vibrio TaxID=662 RepID=A0A7X4LLL8_9VIBR|nr:MULTISPECIES: transporter substrate-binding domain-containing protein [Vibrio]MBF9001054.1 transporter substrate-binding domain-containing protein [Vibrio nitrifigilis]MZI93826.1 transporter substrate-binding domain-containing protein [Vibrio eleionomae]
MKRASAILLTLFSLFSAGSYAADNNTIRIGVDATFAPFEYKKPDGSLAGFEIDLGNAVCAEIHRKCEWVPSNFDGLIPSLNVNRIDAIMSSLGVSEKRRKQVLFTDIVWTGFSSMLSRSDLHLKATPESLKGKVIGVQQGTMQENYVRERFAKHGVQVQTYQDQDQVYADLLNGRIDVSFQDMLQAQTKFIKQGKHSNYTNLKVEDKLLPADSAIAIKKGNEKLVALFNKGLKKIHEDGTYNRIQRQYFGDLNLYRGQ